MATGWERLGQVLGGGSAAREDAYRGRMLENAQGDRAMQLARQAALDTRQAERRMAAEESLADALVAMQAEDQIVQAKGLAEIGRAGLNPNTFASSVARQRQTNTRNQIERDALAGDVTDANARLMSLASAPQALAGEVGGYVVSNRFDEGALGDAIAGGQVGARIPSQIAADQALAGQRNASAARTRALPLNTGRSGNGTTNPTTENNQARAEAAIGIRRALQQSGGDPVARERIYRLAVLRGYTQEANSLMPDMAERAMMTDYAPPEIPVGEIMGSEYLTQADVDRLTMRPSMGAAEPAPAATVPGSPYPEGTTLQGPDGLVYIVRNGVPVPME